VPLVHADLYRIEDARELAELGLTDAFDRAAVAIEWLPPLSTRRPPPRSACLIAIRLRRRRRTPRLTLHGPTASGPCQR
jgi:tRNA A37 threonylcarbamoyladenosine biosynthesis protein TsaE